MTSYTFNDFSLIKAQTCQCYSPGGVFIDTIRDAPLLAGFKEAINAATSSMQVKLPRNYDNFDLVGQPASRGTIAQGNIFRYYLLGPGLPTSGLLRYSGIIDSYEAAIADNGEESLVVTLVPQSSAVADHGLTGTLAFGVAGSSGTYVDPVAMFNYFFNTTDALTGHHYLSPLTLDPTNPLTSGVAYSYTFSNQVFTDIFTTILQMLPANWFYRTNPDNSVTLNVPPVLPQHTFLVGQHCNSPTYRQDWTALKNVIFYKGSGALTSTKTGTDLATFGERLALFTDTRAIDQVTLDALAQGALTALDQVVTRATVRVVDYRGDIAAGLGYDIETIHVGDSCTVIDALSAVVGGINQVVTIAGLSYSFDAVDLELAAFQPSMDRILLQLRQNFQDFTLA